MYDFVSILCFLILEIHRLLDRMKTSTQGSQISKLASWDSEKHGKIYITSCSMRKPSQVA